MTLKIKLPITRFNTHIFFATKKPLGRSMRSIENHRARINDDSAVSIRRWIFPSLTVHPTGTDGNCPHGFALKKILLFLSLFIPLVFFSLHSPLPLSSARPFRQSRRNPYSLLVQRTFRSFDPPLYYEALARTPRPDFRRRPDSH